MRIEDTCQQSYSIHNRPSTFSLFPLHPHCQVQSITFADSAVRLSKNSLPCFNDYKKYFTAAFILSSDSVYLSRNSSFQRLEFQQRRKNHQFSELHCPAPIDRYCQICRVQYFSYLPHVKSPEHLKNIQSSAANSFILDLVSKLCPKRKPIRKRNNSKVEHQPATHNSPPCRTRQEHANAFKMQQTLTKISCDTDLVNSLF